MQLSLTTGPVEYKVMFVLIQLKVVILPMTAMTYPNCITSDAKVPLTLVLAASGPAYTAPYFLKLYRAAALPLIRHRTDQAVFSTEV